MEETKYSMSENVKRCQTVRNGKMNDCKSGG